MGLMDNLECDHNNDQPGQSDMSTQSHSVIPCQKTESPEEDKKTGRNPLDLFIERVTIAGLKEASGDEINNKYLFRIALIAFSGIIIYESIRVADQRMSQSSILDTLNVVNQRAPFPNVSVCFPFFFNSTKAISMYRLIISTSNRANAMARDHNFTEMDIVNSIHRVVTMNTSTSDLASPSYLFTRTVYDELLQSYGEMGQDAWFDMGIPDCPSVLSECKINGQPFDCCNVATPLTIGFSVCYQITVSNLPTHEIASEVPDETILELNAKTDWECGIFDTDNSASDGYHIFINTVPFQAFIPASVPTGMDGTIVLGEPQKLSQIEDCVPNADAQHLKYFDYYDSQGILCMLEAGMDDIQRLFGCQVPAAYYFPFNHSCTFEQMMAVSLATTQMTSLDDMKSSMSVGSELLSEASMEMFEAIALEEKDRLAGMVGRRSSSCQPLCSRWEYPILSVSYAEIDYRDAVKHHELNTSSWSSLKIILPYSSSMCREEKKMPSASYLAMCDIGGMMGVYLGFSMITIIQILVYGIYSIAITDWRGIWRKIRSHAAQLINAIFDLLESLLMVIKGDRSPPAIISEVCAIHKEADCQRRNCSVSEIELITKGSRNIHIDHMKSMRVDKEKPPGKSRIPVLVNLASSERYRHVLAGIEIR